MGEAFRLGGWAMYPTTVFGLVLIAAAVAAARSYTPRALRIVSQLRLLTMLSAALGFVAGMIKTFTSLPDIKGAEPVVIALVGVGESLENIGLGLTMLVIASIITTLGAARSHADLIQPPGA